MAPGGETTGPGKRGTGTGLDRARWREGIPSWVHNHHDLQVLSVSQPGAESAAVRSGAHLRHQGQRVALRVGEERHPLLGPIFMAVDEVRLALEPHPFGAE